MRIPVLLYDGTCGLCNRTVQYILRHDRKKSLLFAPLEGPYGTRFQKDRPHLKGVDSMVWIETEGERNPVCYDIRSTAVLRVAHYLGGLWRLGLVGWLIPRAIRDWIYDRVALHRHLIPGAAECVTVDATTRARFLDLR